MSRWHTQIHIDAALEVPTLEKTREALSRSGIKVSLKNLSTASDAPCKTTGSFFYADFEDLAVWQPSGKTTLLRDPKMLMEMKSSLTAAFHGTSLGAAREVIERRGFTQALNVTEGKQGVYCGRSTSQT